jgi:4-amino-4-deoxy-L-arabinose transferase-like glycosyltransferase
MVAPCSRKQLVHRAVSDSVESTYHTHLTAMSSVESRLQALVNSVEQGRIAGVIRVLLGCAAAVALALLYVLVQFRGLSTETGMDQAQIAREVARGNGFSTKMIRPVAAQQLQDHTGRIPDTNFPDSFNAPLGPLVSSLAMRCLPGELTKKIGTGATVFAGDRLVAMVSVFFFLAAVVVNFFLVLRLFDRRIAWLTTVLVLLADQFWQFSLSGLPQILLLFLFTCAALLLTVAIRAREQGRGTIVWFLLLGIVLGLMALTHPLTLWITAGVGLYCALLFRSVFPRFLIPVIVCLGMFSLWVVRDYRVTGTPFGISPFACANGIGMSESAWMRDPQPDMSRLNVSDFRRRAQSEFSYQLDSLFALLGGVMVAPIYFVSLLHPFKRGETERFKWALALMWFFAFTGSVLIGIDKKALSPNQIQMLFGPLMISYGLAFIFVCWGRLHIQGAILRTVLVAVLLIITGLPLLFGFFSGNPPIQFPPYLPGLMQLFTNWTQPNEIIVSDMPWAVAWYSDRESVWLPANMKTLSDYYDLQTLGKPVAGVFVTPLSRDTGLSDLTGNGEYHEWLALLLPDKKALGTFPFQELLPIADNQCFFFSDRPRWESKK